MVWAGGSRRQVDSDSACKVAALLVIESMLVSSIGSDIMLIIVHYGSHFLFFLFWSFSTVSVFLRPNHNPNSLQPNS